MMAGQKNWPPQANYSRSAYSPQKVPTNPRNLSNNSGPEKYKSYIKTQHNHGWAIFKEAQG
jgi:hypothetical protein